MQIPWEGCGVQPEILASGMSNMICKEIFVPALQDIHLRIYKVTTMARGRKIDKVVNLTQMSPLVRAPYLVTSLVSGDVIGE